MVTAEDKIEDRTVCYGRLDKTKVQAHLLPNPSLKSNFYEKRWWPPMNVTLKRLPGRDNIIRVEDPTGKDFGNIDIKTAYGLARIMDTKAMKIRIQARLAGRPKKGSEYPGQHCSLYLDITLNLYGKQISEPFSLSFEKNMKCFIPRNLFSAHETPFI